MLGRLTLSLLMTLTISSVVACTDLTSEDEETSNLSSEEQACMHDEAAKLAVLKKLHDRYQDINVALADGYKLGVIYNGNLVVNGCVSNLANPALGAMGYHYFLQDRFDDAKIKELKPEVLVYHTGANGTRVLGAVEWVVPKPAWDAKHGVDADAPEVYGQMMMILNPMLNWYVAHAWLWKDNPSGVLSDWNPDVTCP
ncbi:MAG TPA: hypothetical protein VFV99_03230 [Kofleriaceae bacterium]|nr:hypothetical protein [Kofleriaceae bacterium]